MRLAVLNLTGGGASAGYLRYISAVLPRIAADARVSAVLCASPRRLKLETCVPPSGKIEFVDCAPFRFMRHVPDAALARALDSFRPEALFIPLERYIGYRGLPVVTVLHNMAPLAGTATGCGFGAWLKSRAQAIETKIAVKRSAAIIAPTKFVRDFLVSGLGVSADKVPVISFGCSPSGAAPRRPGALNAGAGFIFTAGSLELYRGLEDLIEALPAIRAKVPGVKLAVGGGARPATLPYLRRLKKLAAARGVAGEILWLGRLSDEEISWCYDNCSAFVMTSRMESFGFVSLEAMSRGCACISTDSACLPEIFGDSALYYSPGDAAGLGARAAEVLSRSPEEKDRFRRAALSRARDFSWDLAAIRTVDVIKSVV